MKNAFITLVFLLAIVAQVSAATWYVKTDGNDANAGTSWGAAFKTLQTAINAAVATDEIWVATGTYKPSMMYNGATDRHKTFFINKNIKIFGGFPGTGTPNMANRNTTAFPTTLSGDLGMINNASDNAYHVLFIDHVGTDMWLDGCNIVQGNADVFNDPIHFAGGGIYNNGITLGGSNPTIQYCRFENNLAINGAGMFNNAKDGGYTAPVLLECVFASNSVGTGFPNYGGGMSNNGDNGVVTPILTNCVFQNNTSRRGGGISNSAYNSGVANPTLNNCTFTGNIAEEGGGIFNNVFNNGTASPVLNDCAFNTHLEGGAFANRITNGTATPVFDHCTFTGNTGYTGGAFQNNIDNAICSPTLTNCAFTNNHAVYKGGAYYSLAVSSGAGNGVSNPVITDCTFTHNTTDNIAGNIDESGGAIYCKDADKGLTTPTITGSTFNNNSSEYGGAIWMNLNSPTPLIEQCTFTTNHATYQGGGVFFETNIGTDVAINNCTFTNNTAPYGGGMYLNSTGVDAQLRLIMLRDTFTFNVASEDGGAIYTNVASNGKNGPEFRACIFHDNSAKNGGAICSNGKESTIFFPYIITCLFYNNTATQWGGATCWGNDSEGSFLDCTCYGNTAVLGGGVIGVLSNSGVIAMSRSITWGNSSTFGKVQGSTARFNGYDTMVQESDCPSPGFCGYTMYNVDPLFKNVAAHDFHLTKQSPAKNAAFLGGNGHFDIDGDNRPQGPHRDMGFDEIVVECHGGIVYVDKDAINGNDNGTSWANAFLTLDDALIEANFCNNVTEIWVAEGTYRPKTPSSTFFGSPTKAFFINSDVKIYGGFAGNENNIAQRNWNTHITILSGDVGISGDDSDNAYHVVRIHNRSSAMELDGFTITKGGNDTNADPSDFNNGGGIYNYAESGLESNPTIRNCKITNNRCHSTGAGAGMYNDSRNGNTAPTLENCIFSNNTAPGTANGGGLSNYAYGSANHNPSSSPILINCTFSNNTAGGNGGGMYNTGTNGGKSEPVLENCIFTSNQATTGYAGAIFHLGRWPITLNNCGFSNNSAFTTGAVLGSSIIANDCTFMGNQATTSGAGALNISGNTTGFEDVCAINRCTFSNNSGFNGGALSIITQNSYITLASIDACLFSGNTASINGGAIYTSIANDATTTANFTNCLFRDNMATGRGGVLSHGLDKGNGDIKLTNCTMHHNTATAGGVISIDDWFYAHVNFSMRNCISWNNGSTFAQTPQGQGQLGLIYSIIEENACPTGVLCGTGVKFNQNPQFVNPNTHNFRLQACSPAIDAANSMVAPPVDFEDTPRPQGAGDDMGAFEYMGAPCPMVQAICKNTTVNLDATGTVAVPASSIDNGSLGCSPQLQINNQSTQVYTCANLGANVAILKVTDCMNTFATCSATITVADITAPTVICKPATIGLNNAGPASITTANVFQSGTDNCGIVNQVSVVPNSFTCLNVGANSVVLTVNDGKGNTATCSALVTITGGTAPTITCPANIVRSTDPNLCAAIVSYTTPTYTSSCAAGTLSYVSGGLSGSMFTKGTTTVLWKVTDGGQSQTCAFTVTVTDGQAPNITCPANQSVNNNLGQCSATVTYLTPTATDNCSLPAGQPVWISGGSTPSSSGATSGSIFQKGINTVTWKATDGAGLTKTCTFRVTVNDTEKPNFVNCPTPINVNATTGLCSAVVPYTNPEFTDNCAPTSGISTKISGLASGSSFPVGSNNIVFQATDAAGNTRRCTVVVTVIDNQPPVITCPMPVVVTGSGTPCTATAIYSGPTASDNCAGALTPFLLTGLASGSTFPAGVTTNTFRAITPNGQTADCSFTVTVNCGDGMTGNSIIEVRNDTSGDENNLHEQQNRLDISLAPNPALSSVTVSIEGIGTSGGTLLVFDPVGKLVFQQVINEGQQTTTLSVESAVFAPGLYRIHLKTAIGMVTKTLVVVK
jgi:HYR domain